MQEFQVSRDGIPVGKVTLEFEGLYCKICCFVKDSGNIVRLVDRRGTKELSIGICGPIRGGFGVEKRIPKKYMVGDSHEFVILPQMDRNLKFYPLDEPIPLFALKQPDNWRFLLKNQKPGFVIENCPECMRCRLSD